MEYDIDSGEVHPIKQSQRPVPLPLRPEVSKIISTMLKQSVEAESSSAWSSPCVLVKNKDGTIRFCIDFRKVSKAYVRDSYLCQI